MFLTFSYCRAVIKDFLSKAPKFVTQDDECRHGWYVLFLLYVPGFVQAFALLSNGKNREEYLEFWIWLIYLLISLLVLGGFK